MPARRKTRSPAAARQLAEIGLAAPQVVAHRVARMALAGPKLSARDQREFTGMVTEKQLAIAQSWIGMATEALSLHNEAINDWLLNPSALSVLAQALKAGGAIDRVVGKGLEPVHRKAVANSRRLARTRLR